MSLERNRSDDGVRNDALTIKKSEMLIGGLDCENKLEPILLYHDDLKIEIFSRLPLKFLLKCKCVCKSWHHLISDPVFISHYTRHYPLRRVSGLLFECNNGNPHPELEFIGLSSQIDPTPKLSLGFIQAKGRIVVRHACNGLLICRSFSMHELNRKYFICNPTTKQHSLLHIQEENLEGLNIAFDPYISSHYQVISIYRTKGPINQFQIKIYNPTTGSWRCAGEPFSVSEAPQFQKGVYSRGALHWMDSYQKQGIRFDVEREVLNELPVPPVKKWKGGWGKFTYFGESGGDLYLTRHHRQTKTLRVLVMKEDYSTWFVKYNVELTPIARAYPEMVKEYPDQNSGFCFSVLHIVGEKGGEDPFMILNIQGKFVSYNLKGYTFRDLTGLPPRFMTRRKDSCTQETIFPYINTLCCL